MTPQPLSSSFKEIPIAQALESATNPRKRFNPAALEELAQSIRSHGIRLPLLVRPDKSQPDAYEIVAGARRYRAATIAGLQLVPVLVREMTDQEVLEVQVIENLQREDVHPLEEAMGYRALMKSSGVSVKEIAAKLGKSEPYVYQRMKLTELIEKGKELFLNDHITTAMAMAIARLQPKDQAEAVKGCTPHPEHSYRSIATIAQLESWIERNTLLDLTKATFDVLDPNLNPPAGACPDCPKRTGYSPALFAAIANQDTCTDKRCFNKKLDIHFKTEANRPRASGLPVHISESDWTGPKSQLLTAHQYVRIEGDTPTCESSGTGIVADGTNRGAILAICADQKCKVHFPEGQPKRSQADWQAQNRLEELPGVGCSPSPLPPEKRKLDRAVNHAITIALAKKMKPGRNRKADLLMVLSESDLEQFITEMAGLPDDLKAALLPVQTVYELATADLKKVTEDDLIQSILLNSLSLMSNSWRGLSKGLEAAAARYNLDVPAIRKQVRAELKAKAKEKPAAAAEESE